MFRRLFTNLFLPIRHQQRTMKVVVNKVLADNYMYYIIDSSTREAYVVDLDTSKVASIAQNNEVEIKGALVTHHHWDHSAGASDFAKEYPNAPIYGQDKERIPDLTNEVTDGQVIQWNSIQITCFSTPGHTTSHVCYYVHDTENNQRALFTGDTLFLAGCGKFFECKANVMYASLARLLEVVDDDTDMYFGHEYSLTNLKFAKLVQPQNRDVFAKFEECKHLLQDGKPTCPSKWAGEKLYNPFLRVGDVEVKSFANASDPIEVLEKIREAKDKFKP